MAAVMDLFTGMTGNAQQRPSAAFIAATTAPKAKPRAAEQGDLFAPKPKPTAGGSNADNKDNDAAGMPGVAPRLAADTVQQGPEPRGALQPPVAGPPGPGGGVRRDARPEHAGVPVPGQPQGTRTDAGIDADSGRSRSGPRAHALTNISAIRIAKTVEAEKRLATDAEKEVLSKYRGWGGLSQIFGDKPEWQDLQQELRSATTEAEFAACRLSTINAHYTDESVSAEMWKLVRFLGFEGGNVIEPGVGRGVFISGIPTEIAAQTLVTGVELDPVTAKIAKALHPDHDIRNEGFEDTRIKPDTFALAIGNVPFADVKLNDREYNHERQYSMHNHFILKSLALTQPGGLACILTSRYTMDSKDNSARVAMNDLADLVCSVRLPENSFKKSADTEVVTDCLVFRRRAPGEPPRSDAWLDSIRNPVGDKGGEAWFNRYYVEHKSHILGEHALTRGMHHADELTVLPSKDRPLAEAMAAAFADIAAKARADGQVCTASPIVRHPEDAVQTSAKKGAFCIVDGKLHVHDFDGSLNPDHGVRDGDVEKVMRLTVLRDTAREIINLQRRPWDGQGTAPWADAQRRLGEHYDGFLEKYGPINKVDITVIQPKKAGDKERTQRRYPNLYSFSKDPDLIFTAAIELYDELTHTSKRAPIFDTRVLSPTRVVTESATVSDALLVSLDETGRIDLERIGQLVKRPPEECAAEMLAAKLIYRVPRAKGETEIRYEVADEYLSGEVKSKLALAESAARKRPDLFQGNVEALKAVIPKDIPPSQIDIILGAGFVDKEDVADFVRETLDVHDIEVGHNKVENTWTLSGGRAAKSSVKGTVEWGTRRMDALTLIGHALHQRPPEVFDTDENDKKIRNPTETLAALAKMEKLNQHFSKWVWQDEDRTVRLCRKYNDTFNGTVLRTYSGSGAHMSFPGLSSTFTLNPHQQDAVFRGLQGNTLLAHDVGLGKTAIGISIAMKAKHIGLCNLTGYAVPGSMLLQAATEWQRMYPDANILAATPEDLSEAGRLRLQAKLACGSYDAVILTHSGLNHIGVLPETERKFIEAECEDQRRALEEARKENPRSLSVKSIERSIKKLEEKLEERIKSSEKDKLLAFEELGIDRLVIDESHLFKNLPFATKQQNVNSGGSQRATNLFMKVRYLESIHPGNCLTFMSATPIANAIAEGWTNCRYLALDKLKKRGIASYDAWSAAFARAVTKLEIDLTGGFRMKSRIAGFSNAPELITQFREFADVVTREMVPAIAVPTLKGGKPQVVAVEASPEQKAKMLSFADRAERIRSRSVTPDQDNMLAIFTEGRKLSLDGILVGLKTESETKIQRAADEIMRIHGYSKDYEYLGKDGKPSPNKGASIVVFCDTSTPCKKDGSWNAYDALKQELIKRGMPPKMIRFAHEADGSDEKKARLFEDCREQPTVIIGSTDKLGVGVNIQNRLIAEIDLDCPFRPDQITQRSGRLLRQGSQNYLYNREVEIIRMVTKGTFDSYMWQLNEQKASFISQYMRGSLDARTIADISDHELSYAEVKALATGDPRLMEKAVIDAEVTKLTRLKSSYEGERWSLRGKKHSAIKEIERLERDVADLESSIRRRQDTAGDRFRGRVGGGDFTERKAFGEALIAAARRQATGTLSMDGKAASAVSLGSVGGFSVRCETGGRTGVGRADIILDAPYRTSVGAVDLKEKELDPLGVVRTLENRLRSFDVVRSEVIARISELRGQIAQAEQQLSIPWEHQAALDAALAKQQEIDALLNPPDPAAVAAARAEKAAIAFEQVLSNGPDALRGKDDGRDLADLAGEHAASLLATDPDHWAALQVQRHLEIFRTPAIVTPPPDSLSAADLHRRQERAFRLLLDCPAGVDSLGREKSAEVLADARTKADALLSMTPDHAAAAKVIRNLTKLESERSTASAPSEPAPARAYG